LSLVAQWRLGASDRGSVLRSKEATWVAKTLEECAGDENI